MRRNPLLIVSAMLAALGPLVGNGIYAGPNGAGEQQLASLRDGLPTAGYVGLTLEIIGFIALCVVVACLVAALARRSPVAAATTGVAGAAMVAVKLGSAAFVMTAYHLADSLNATEADVLITLNGMAFVLSGLLLSLSFGAAGLGLLRTSAPRWVGRVPAVLGPLGVAAALVGVADPDAYVPIPFLLLLLWMIALALWSVMAHATEEDGSANDGAASLTGATMSG